jgi:hypothetical protein
MQVDGGPFVTGASDETPGVITWRLPRLATVLGVAMVLPLGAFSTFILFEAFARPHDQLVSIFGIALAIACLGYAGMAVSVPAMCVRIEGDQLVVVNHFWTVQQVPLSSVKNVTTGQQGLTITTNTGESLFAWAVPDFWGTFAVRNTRAARIAEHIMGAAAQHRPAP